jgi:hypothetical protein
MTGICRVGIMLLSTKLLNICAFTLHIRQTLATFLVIQFPPQLVNLKRIVNSYFCQSDVQSAVSFSILKCIKLWYVNDQIIKTAILKYLILRSHSERENKMALLNREFYIFSEHNAYCCVGVGEKLNIKKR